MCTEQSLFLNVLLQLWNNKVLKVGKLNFHHSLAKLFFESHCSTQKIRNSYSILINSVYLTVSIYLVYTIFCRSFLNSIVVWDFASAASSSEINFPDLDAAFFSGHKLMGGVYTPGVLLIKKHLIKAKKPKRIGGGTVSFVSLQSYFGLLKLICGDKKYSQT